ncbi:MAG TPA: hydrogenase accessory protein HupE [Chromatiaceae bacterium]|nr:hydrogenase accessory protein HupE [Chromatiaceae bacterium]
MSHPTLPAIEVPPWETGNVQPLLHEIGHALRELLNNNKETCIDLHALPMAPGEEARLVEALGKGEISVQLRALGKSRIDETKYPGVWLITHFNANEEVVGKFIEITRIPDLIKSQREDIAAGLLNLEDELHEE